MVEICRGLGVKTVGGRGVAGDPLGAKELNVDRAQGYHIGLPFPSAAGATGLGATVERLLQTIG
jgi:hypothetical protein